MNMDPAENEPSHQVIRRLWMTLFVYLLSLHPLTDTGRGIHSLTKAPNNNPTQLNHRLLTQCISAHPVGVRIL